MYTEFLEDEDGVDRHFVFSDIQMFIVIQQGYKYILYCENWNILVTF